MKVIASSRIHVLIPLASSTSYLVGCKIRKARHWNKRKPHPLRLILIPWWTMLAFFIIRTQTCFRSHGKEMMSLTYHQGRSIAIVWVVQAVHDPFIFPPYSGHLQGQMSALKNHGHVTLLHVLMLVANSHVSRMSRIRTFLILFFLQLIQQPVSFHVHIKKISFHN